MTYKDYYQVLGVPPESDTEAIRAAYKKLAVKHHPDANPGNETSENRFKEISEAKEILLDPAHRQRYDALRQQHLYRQQLRQQAQQQPGRPPTSAPEEEDYSFSTFFDEIFGNRRRGPRRGKNYEANVKITLGEAYHGMTDVLSFEGRRLRVRIRPGIIDGQTLRIKGQGGTGKLGGPNGDLYLTVKVTPDDRFEREGQDLYLDLTLNLYDALLGKKIEVPSLSGTKRISLPPSTQPGERLKLRGLGMPYYDQPERFGDLYVRIQVRLPERLSEAERQLIEQLAALRQTSR
jgi:curved DNA-binding protein